MQHGKEHAHCFPPSRALLGGWPATRKVRARVHACLDAVQRAARCMCTRRDVQPLQRCIADPTCTERLGAPVYRSQRAAQGYHYGGSRHSLLIAGFQRESRPYERTNERSQLRSLAIIIFSAARKDESRTRPEIRIQTRAKHGVFRFQNAYERIRSPVEFLPASLNIPPAIDPNTL